MKNRIAVAILFLLPLLLLAYSHAPAQESAAGARKIITCIVPEYPVLARKLRIEGNVRAEVVVAPDGKVKSVELRGGHPVLGQAAADALRQWRWEPAAHDTHEMVELKFNM